MENLRPHLRPTLLLALPVMLSQLGHVLVNFVDSVVVGHIGKVPLAAVGVGVSTTSVLLVLGVGLSMGSVPLVAAADGRRDLPELGRLLVASVWTNALAGLVLAGLGQLVPPFLHLLGQPPEVVALAGPWVQVISLSLFPLMVFQGFREFAEGLGLTREAMWLSILGNVLNGLLCYALVYGHLGLPAMGMMGSAWATLMARGLMAAFMAIYVLRAKRLRAERAAVTSWLPVGATVRRVVDLGAPIGVQMALEVGAFGLSLLMAGWLGVTTEAAHKVAIDVASMTYMAASGIAAAATIRVGNLRGAGDLNAARHAGFAAYWLTFGFMGSMALLLILTRHLVPYIYISDPQVVAQASTLLLIAALFQVSDGLQVVGLGALRGLEDVKVPSVVALLAYWAVALPLGYFLGFKLHMGAPGVWTGLLVGLSIVATVLLLRFRRETEPDFAAALPAEAEERATV
ncbi:MATE family efflux transporter [Hymenobacter sp. BT770]|uniref:MATE family efflux transporter n=1 Tax=Hymenobacter sp. BT770 TaxID=2886942 RepID=UPI001D0FA77D|nr:MATE family efflux transporter [Hymenobacter sp. BT770]MCC3152348.1 MATE family efflux transporter [Hymenobacter sp. BT770]MDO3414161.1 MATE family efflux transporter [Hymenobacter sp. BT770]